MLLLDEALSNVSGNETGNETGNRDGEFFWSTATRLHNNNRTVEGPEPGVHPACHNCTGNAGNNSNIPELPANYPAACHVAGYAKNWHGPLGCTCKDACFLKNSSDTASPMVCHTESLCFGKTTGTCVSSAEDAATCHSTCKTCSPGRDLNGDPAKSACRKCKSDSTAWMPEPDPNCALGNQQGSCKLFPSPKQQCKVACSPRWLTTDAHIEVLAMNQSVAPESELTYNNETGTQHNLPTLVCNKMCTVGLPLRFGDAYDAFVFCTVSKQVTCRKQDKYSNESQPTLRCNSDKKVRFIGYQRHNDKLVLERTHPFQDDKIFYTSQSNSTAKLVQEWSSLADETVKIKTSDGMVSQTPPTAETGGADFVTYTALKDKAESDLCLAHALIS